MGWPAWKCPCDPVCKPGSACSSERLRLKKKQRADAVLAAAAVAFLAVALTCGALLAARPTARSDPAAAAAAVYAAVTAAEAPAVNTAAAPPAFGFVTPLKRAKRGASFGTLFHPHAPKLHPPLLLVFRT